MARVTYVEGIVSVRGALDSVKEGQNSESLRCMRSEAGLT
jgi:hypothetical protein